MIENGTVSIRRIYEMAELEPERDDGTVDVIPEKGQGSWPVRGSIVFDEFSMRYK